MKIFLSSTAYDLGDFRDLVVDRLEKLGHEVIYHERGNFPIHSGYHSHDECILAIEQCDIVLCILDKRYGGKYVGIFKDDFHDQTIEVIGDGGNRHFVTIPQKDLSVTWCELITAYSKKKDVITFSRQRTLDEKDTRRKNQDIVDFKPAYVEKKEIFDLLDWITKQKVNNWIIPFNTIVDFEKKLIAWVEEKSKQTITSKAYHDNSYKQLEGNLETKLPYNLKTNVDKRICIIVEREIDRYVVRNIISKLNILVQSRIDIFPIGGSSRIFSNLINIIEKFENQYDHIVVLLNAETMDAAEIGAKTQKFKSIIQSKNKDDVSIFLAVPEIEAWILAGTEPETNNKLKDDKIQNMQYIYQVINTKFNLDSALRYSADLKKFVDYLNQIVINK